MMNNGFYSQPYQQIYGHGYPQPVPDQLAMYRQPYVQAGQQMQGIPQATQHDSPMNWVQGEAGAKAYIVAPGGTAVLWDSEAEVIYIKSANAAGMPSMRVFDYRERVGAPTAPVAAIPSCGDYVTRQEFDALVARLNALTATEKEDRDGE